MNDKDAAFLNAQTHHQPEVEHPIEKEITQSFVDYSMSVIISRALPDTRDWLKPVIRRILFWMYQMNNVYNQKHKKSARIVGEVMWKYHPHGDASIYDAMVRLAQTWSMRYPLVDGQGNFGSIDWDGAAAMRYTEARLTRLAEEMMDDIEQDTVDWRLNFDGTLKEPVMLPTKFPNQLCNGTMWIAVWMATNMAPHNLNEVLDACHLLLQKEWKKMMATVIDENGMEVEKEVEYSVSVDEIMEIIKGPDFPTGWVIFDRENIKEVYRKWKGPIVVRGKTHTEVYEDSHVIVIDEIPYLVNKSALVSKIGELVVDKKIEWISDIRDESNKNKNRIVLYLRKGVNPDAVLVQLYKFTELQTNFNINNVSLVEWGTQPRLLNIKELLMEFLTFRREVVRRRSEFQLQKAKDRLHILEWLKRAIDIIDDVIYTIRHSVDKKEAKDNLILKFQFSEEQAEYILQMRLQSLVWLEIQKVLDEIAEKQAKIAELTEILANPEKLDGVVQSEFDYMKQKYGDERKTEVSDDTSLLNLSWSIKAIQAAADRIKEDVICRIGADYSMRVLYQSRIQTIPEETIDLIYTHNQDRIIVITDLGELVVQRLKDFGSQTMAKPAVNLKNHFNLKWKVVFAKTLHYNYEYLTFLTNQNNIKKIKKELVLSFKKFPTVIMNLGQGEKIVKVEAVNDSDNLWVITKQWWMLLFNTADLRPMWKTAWWVKAIELQEWDQVANMFLYKDEPFILIHSNKNAKLLSLDDLKIWKRAKKWQVVMTGNDELEGWLSIIEWAVRLRFDDGSMETLHSNNIHLAEPETPLVKISDKAIAIAYRPWEEKDENRKYKDEKKKNWPEEQDNLFTIPGVVPSVPVNPEEENIEEVDEPEVRDNEAEDEFWGNEEE